MLKAAVCHTTALFFSVFSLSTSLNPQLSTSLYRHSKGVNVLYNAVLAEDQRLVITAVLLYYAFV